MDSNGHADENGFGEESNEDEYENKTGKSGIIFLIDARTSMFKKEFEDSSNEKQASFIIALKCARSLMLNKIIARNNDMMAIVLFGTEKEDSKTSKDYLTLLLDLSRPNAEAVRTLDGILKDKDGEEFQRIYGCHDNPLISETLWYCCTLFAESKVIFDTKRILMFTNDPDQHCHDLGDQYLAIKRGKDLAENNIGLDLLPMGRKMFESKFYKELLQVVNNSDEIEATSTKLEELLERINRIDFRTRRYANMKWDIGNEVFIGVSLFSMRKEANVLPQETLDGRSNEPVKRVRQITDQSSGDLLLQSDVENYVDIGGEKIVLSNEEKEILTKVDEPYMRLLGFRDLSSVTVAQHYGNPAFAVPQESLVSGSKGLMKSLALRCSERGKVALCALTPRHRALTKFVFLVPSEDYSGFHVIPIPFENDLKEQNLKKSSSAELPTEAKEIAKNIIGKLKFTYEPKGFQNPKLQKFWAHLEALALDYEAPDVVLDQTAPDSEAQTRRLGDLTGAFNEACKLTGAPTGPTGTKRSHPPLTGPSGAKRAAKGPELDDRDFEESIRKAAAENKLEKFTVVQLERFLSIKGQKVPRSKKADLIKHVKEYIH